MNASLRALLFGLLACFLHAPSVKADTYTWKTNALGNWSVASNWEGGVVPPTDGTADIVLKFTTDHYPWDYYWNSNVDAAWSTNGSVRSITFDAAERLDLSMDDGSVLHLGAGGLTVLTNPQNAALFSGTLDFSVNQDITLYAGIANYGMNFVSPTNVTVTFKGNPNWAEFSFLYGSSAGFQGRFASAVQSLVQIVFNRYADQFDRLGTNTFVHLNTERTSFNFYDEHSTGDAVKTFHTPIYSDCTGQSTKIIYLNFLGSLPTGCTSYRMNCTAPISTTYLEPPWNGAIQISGSTDLTRNNKVFFQADSSGIGAANAGWASPLIRASYGYFVLDHTNAWGTGNGYRYDMGLWNGGRGCALKATSGNHVNSRLIYNLPSETAIPDQRVLGLEGTGAVTFSGEIDIVRSASASAITHQYLVAPPEGTVTFSGQLRDDYGGTDYYSPVFIAGGGTVILSGNVNNYGGTTTVTNNTLLLVNGTSGYGAGVGALTVVSGSTLGGTGVVSSAGTTILAGGALTAGPTNAIGTLTVNNLTLQADAILKWDGNATSGDKLVALGTTTLPAAATVVVSRLDGTRMRRSKVIIDAAAAISGDPSGWTVTAPQAGYSITKSADGKQVLLWGPQDASVIVIR